MTRPAAGGAGVKAMNDPLRAAPMLGWAPTGQAGAAEPEPRLRPGAEPCEAHRMTRPHGGG
jgi:hypothetical protein